MTQIRACDWLVWEGIDGDGVTRVWYAAPQADLLFACWPKPMTPGAMGQVHLPSAGPNNTVTPPDSWRAQINGETPGGFAFAHVPDLTGRARDWIDYTRIIPTGGLMTMTRPMGRVAYLAERVDRADLPAPLQSCKVGFDWGDLSDFDLAAETFEGLLPQILGA